MTNYITLKKLKKELHFISKKRSKKYCKNYSNLIKIKQIAAQQLKLSKEKKMKMFNLISLLVISLTYGNLAHSGEGRNGPDQSGLAIPLELDREITVNSIKNITRECYQQTYNDLFSAIVDKSSRRMLTECYLELKEVKSGNAHKLVTECSRFPHGLYEIRGNIVSPQTSLSFGVNGVYFRLITQNGPTKYQSEMSSPKNLNNLPSFQYETVIADSSISVFGEVIPGKKVVRNLKLLGTDTEPFFLENKKTGYRTGIEIDLRNVSTCMESAITNL